MMVGPPKCKLAAIACRIPEQYELAVIPGILVVQIIENNYMDKSVLKHLFKCCLPFLPFAFYLRYCICGIVHLNEMHSYHHGAKNLGNEI